MKHRYSMFSLLRRFLRGNPGVVWVTLALHLINSLTAILTPFFQQVYTDNVITRENPEWFTPLMICYGILLLLALVSWLLINSHRKRHISSLGVTVSSRYMWTLLRMPMSLVDRFSSGELASRYGSISSAVWRIEADLPVLVLWMEPIICTWLLLLYNVKLAIIETVLMTLLLVSIYLNIIVQQKKSRKMADAGGHMESVTMNGLNNIETIKSLGGEQAFYKEWDLAYTKYANARVNANTTMMLMGEIPEVVFQLSDVVLLSLGGWYILQGDLTPGMLMAMMGLAGNMVYPLGKIMTVAQQMTNTHSTLERMAEVTDYDPQLDEIELPPADMLSSPEALSKNFPDGYKLNGDIELRNVTFGYVREQPPILKDFSLSIKAGQQVAFVGFSGCGKSTIAKLISGLYDPWEGDVLFDGKPRREINRLLFVNSVSVVNQDITLFEGSVSDNIKMWDNSIDDTTMIAAAKAAQIHDDIAERSGAYRSVVAENGKNFSGGQRQRIEIATALAKKPTILVLDEATSALDNKAEAQVTDHLRQLGITTIIIAHRLSTIRHCDCIYVMEHGKVLQQGTYDGLAAQEGLFKELINHA